MPVLLFPLRNVPADEAEEIRELLTSNQVEFYETPAGRWGISAPGIWLQDEKALHAAKSLIQAYQKERVAQQRREYESLKRAGENKTIMDSLRKNPLQFVLYLAIIVIVLYFSIKPFFGLGR